VERMKKFLPGGAPKRNHHVPLRLATGIILFVLTAIRAEHGKKTDWKMGVFMRGWKPKETIFTVVDFYVEADVIEVEERDVWTKEGNILTRLKVRDESGDATLVVWGSEDNQRNLELLRREPKPQQIQIIHPVRPFDEYIFLHKVDLWAHQDLTKIEIIQ
jgi:hypothetical protein